MCQGPGVQVVASASAGAGAAAEHGGYAGIERFLDLLGADPVDVRIDCRRRLRYGLRRRSPRCRADDDVDARLDIRVSGLADGGDAAIFSPRSALTIPNDR